jgi:hypothetical protein
MQRPDLNRLQKTALTTAREKQSLNNCPRERQTLTSTCEKEHNVRPQETALSTRKKQRLNVRLRENGKT